MDSVLTDEERRRRRGRREHREVNEMSNLHLCLLLSFLLDFSLAVKDDTADPVFFAQQSIGFFFV